MELRQIEYFVVLAHHGNFTHAAAALGVAQPALSQQIKRLEDELGVRLVDRTTRPVRLTDAGQAFHTRAQRILAESRLAGEEMREFAGMGRGRLVIGALPALAALWLPTVLGRFQARHPGIELALREHNTEELARLVGQGQLDLAVLHAVPGLPIGHGAPEGIVVERLFEEELVAIVPPGHHLAGGRSLTMARLRDEPFVIMPRGSGLTHTLLTAAAAEGYRPRVAAESADIRTLRNLVAAGLGVSVVPRLPAEGPGPPVAVLRLRPPLPTHTTSVAWRDDSRPSGAAEAMLALLRDEAGGGPGSRRRRPG
jgi:LysR family transcriptional activator of glutamate synthase operon